MKLRRWVAALFVAFALGGCGPGAAGQAPTQYAPYSHDSGSDIRGGADGGSGGGM